MTVDKTTFLQASKSYAEKVDSFIVEHPFISNIKPDEVREGAIAYLRSGGKRMRPFLAKLACELCGGSGSDVLPAAAATEIFHMWTLVHDDIIDRDELRRGAPTLHKHYSKEAESIHDLISHQASHYGMSLSILTGDVQHGFAMSLICDLERILPAPVVLCLVREMTNELLVNLMKGEVLDVQFAFLHKRRPSLENLLDMIAGKTSALLEYCVIAGATVGLKKYAPASSPTRELIQFARSCGIAFQLQDDLLTLTSDEKVTGKPFGSDLREGKYTPTVHFALEKAEGRERARILDTLGQPDLSHEDIEEVVELFESLGALQRTRDLANQHVDRAMSALESLPEGEPLEYLKAWADFALKRSH